MIKTLQPLDIAVVIGLLLFLLVASFYSSFKQKSAEEYFMADRSLRWWSVAGSIFGTNIHAQQIIGMMGIGYSIGFAQSHYEVWAVPAILILVYVFIPIYRKRNFFTLSQFLENRYNSQTRLSYMVVMLAFIMIQLIGGFYIGSRTLIFLFQDSAMQLTYTQGILIIAVVTVVFTVFGGMESVVVADNILTVIMILAVLIMGTLTYMQPEIGGISGLLKLDYAAENKMHLYLPSNHKDLPWSGIFSGLTILNFFYWTTNQYQVQRVLAAKTDYDAKLGSIFAGCLKLIIPFFSIAAGTAAYYIFKARFGVGVVKPDDTFMTLLQEIVPGGLGFKGLILAGLICAIFSAIYSMMNSVSTMFAFDIYKKHINQNASDKKTVRYGQLFVVLMCIVAIFLAQITFDPNSSENFFLKIAKQTSYIKPGLVIVFFWGVFWKKTNPWAAVIVMLGSPIIGYGCDLLYANVLANIPWVVATFGENLNFLYRVFLITFFGSILIYSLSHLLNKKGAVLKDEGLELVVDTHQLLLALQRATFIHAPLIFICVMGYVSSQIVAFVASGLTFALFLWYAKADKSQDSLFKKDLFYAGILSTAMVFIMYFFA
jgi:SSS family solute:Na+ symporter